MRPSYSQCKDVRWSHTGVNGFPFQRLVNLLVASMDTIGTVGGSKKGNGGNPVGVCPLSWLTLAGEHKLSDFSS